MKKSYISLISILLLILLGIISLTYVHYIPFIDYNGKKHKLNKVEYFPTVIINPLLIPDYYNIIDEFVRSGNYYRIFKQKYPLNITKADPRWQYLRYSYYKDFKKVILNKNYKIQSLKKEGDEIHILIVDKVNDYTLVLSMVDNQIIDFY